MTRKKTRPPKTHRIAMLAGGTEQAPNKPKSSPLARFYNTTQNLKCLWSLPARCPHRMLNCASEARQPARGRRSVGSFQSIVQGLFTTLDLTEPNGTSHFSRTKNRSGTDMCAQPNSPACGPGAAAIFRLGSHRPQGMFRFRNGSL